MNATCHQVLATGQQQTGSSVPSWGGQEKKAAGTRSYVSSPSRHDLGVPGHASPGSGAGDVDSPRDNLAEEERSHW